MRCTFQRAGISFNTALCHQMYKWFHSLQFNLTRAQRSYLEWHWHNRWWNILLTAWVGKVLSSVVAICFVCGMSCVRECMCQKWSTQENRQCKWISIDLICPFATFSMLFSITFHMLTSLLKSKCIKLYEIFSVAQVKRSASLKMIESVFLHCNFPEGVPELFISIFAF